MERLLDAGRKVTLFYSNSNIGTAEEFERRLIREALRKSRGNVAAAARELGLTVRILHYTIRKLGVVPQEFR